MAVPEMGQVAQADTPAGAEGADKKTIESRDHVVIRFAGDSGDGMQLTGMQFATESAIAGNDLATLPDFPAEIRAPAGTLAGVSGYQLNFSSHEVFTPGDEPSVLVAMNPAGLKVNIEDLLPNGVLIVDKEAFNESNLKKAGYTTNPLTDGSLSKYQLFQIEVTKLTALALRDLGMNTRAINRCRNFFVLGLVTWLFHRPVQPTLDYVNNRFKKTPEISRPTCGRSEPATISAKRPKCSRVPTRCRRLRSLPAFTATSPATARPRWASWRRRSSPGVRCSWVRIRSLPPATFFTSCPATRISRCARSRPKTRSRESRRRSALPSGARWLSRPLPVRAWI